VYSLSRRTVVKRSVKSQPVQPLKLCCAFTFNYDIDRMMKVHSGPVKKYNYFDISVETSEVEVWVV
jgi:hypothetical protein